MRKPTKPCKKCGHAKTHHWYALVPIPFGHFKNYSEVYPCQDCLCDRYQEVERGIVVTYP